MHASRILKDLILTFFHIFFSFIFCIYSALWLNLNRPADNSNIDILKYLSSTSSVLVSLFSSTYFILFHFFRHRIYLFLSFFLILYSSPSIRRDGFRIGSISRYSVCCCAPRVHVRLSAPIHWGWVWTRAMYAQVQDLSQPKHTQVSL